MERTVAWNTYNKTELRKLETVSKEYRAFLDAGKTERECVTAAIERAKAAGYRDLKEIIAENGKLKAGDRVYADCMGKALMRFIVGKKPMEKGCNILGAHNRIRCMRMRALHIWTRIITAVSKSTSG